MTPMRLRRTAAGALVLVLAPALLAACGEDADASPGDVIPARYDDQFEEGTRASVKVPLGTILIRAEEPVTQVAADETRELQPLEAPPGMSFVPITWQYDSWSAGEYDPYLDTTEVPTVDLLADGEPYRLPSPDRKEEDGESFYVLVDGDATDRSLEIEFDGVVQRVDLVSGQREEGRAEPLYDLDDVGLRLKPCDTADWFDTADSAAQLSCDYRGPVMLPYAGGEWAEPGRQWLAISLETHMRGYALAGPEGGGAQYNAQSIETEVLLDGQEPVHAISTGDTNDVCPVPGTGDCNFSKHLIFDVPADEEPEEITVEQAYRMVLGVRWGNFSPPDRVQAEGSTTIRLGAGRGEDAED